LWQESYRQKSAEVENLGLATKGKDEWLVEQEVPVSSSGPQTATGELVAGRVAKPSPVDLASVKFIVSTESIADAWKKVKSNKGAPGVDGVKISEFPKWAKRRWKQA
jgi:hypothetical protein